MKQITPRQKEILEYIRDFIRENEFSPSTRDISEHFHFSVKAAYDHLQALESKSLISSIPGISRSVKIIDPQFSPYEDVMSIPITDSELHETKKNGKNLLYLSKKLLPEEDSCEYIITMIKDDALSDEGIYYGDVAAIKLTDKIHEGQIVLAESKQLGPLVRFYHEEKGIPYLTVSNISLSSIPLTADIEIKGTLSLLFRQFRDLS
ncbi:MAG: hypothetical protein LKE40_05385 [Spirochaetia bacterium]|jgi:repressor LexA|nr:hypothetical protein [Spirochaetia bacterium]